MSKINYPCLMVGSFSGVIVLFTKEGIGIVKGTGNKHRPYSIGHYSDQWRMQQFKPIASEVVCSR